MILGSEQLSFTLRVASVVAPVALYFLILGLLNSRRHPQLLTGRQDFALLIVALSPLVLLPLLNFLGPSAPALLAATGACAGAIALAAPARGNWVMYNISPGEARKAVQNALEDLGVSARRVGRELHLPGGAVISLGAFPLLRNVSIRLTGGRDDFDLRLQDALAGELHNHRAETQPMAMAMLLVATAMLVAPAALMARHAPEIVRILTDILQ